MLDWCMSGCGVHGQCKITSVDWRWSCCLDSLNESYLSFILSRLWKSVYAKASAYILLNSEQLHRSADLSLYTKQILVLSDSFPTPHHHNLRVHTHAKSHWLYTFSCLAVEAKSAVEGKCKQSWFYLFPLFVLCFSSA